MANQDFPVIEIAPSGKPSWMGGAWCLVWVYSTEGNFLLKGFREECENYIVEKGWKCWAIYNLYHTKAVPFYKIGKPGENYRTIISTYKCGFEISKPSRIDKKKSSQDFKYRIYEKGNWRNSIFVKRLPTQFVNFNVHKLEAPGTLGDNSSLRGLKDKLDSQS
jgi:hypothetical protein